MKSSDPRAAPRVCAIAANAGDQLALGQQLREPGLTLVAAGGVSRDRLRGSDLIVLVAPLSGASPSASFRDATEAAAWGGIRLLVVPDAAANPGDPSPSAHARTVVRQFSGQVVGALTVPVPGLDAARAAGQVARALRSLHVMLAGGDVPDFDLLVASGRDILTVGRWGMALGHGQGGVLDAVDAAIAALPTEGPYTRLRVDFAAAQAPDAHKVHVGVTQLEQHLEPGAPVEWSVRALGAEAAPVRVTLLAAGGSPRAGPRPWQREAASANRRTFVVMGVEGERLAGLLRHLAALVPPPEVVLGPAPGVGADAISAAGGLATVAPGPVVLEVAVVGATTKIDLLEWTGDALVPLDQGATGG